MTVDNPIILPNKLRDPFLFEDVIDIQEGIYSNSVIDLSKISFIEPYSMISLLLLGKNHIRSKGEKIKMINIPISIHQYFIRMDFLKTGIFDVSEKINKDMLLKRSPLSRRIIEITEIPNKERESIVVITDVISLFRKRASNILKYWISDRIIDYFVTVISELCQNIFEHSLDSGYLAMQTYSVGKENIFRLVISDSGIGIRRSFEENNNVEYSSPAGLMEKAIFTPISSKREFGYGLCQVNEIVERLKGTLFIRSENASITALYHRKNKGAPFLFLKNNLSVFCGTQISISLSG